MPELHIRLALATYIIHFGSSGNKTECPLHESCYDLQEMPWYWGNIDR